MNVMKIRFHLVAAACLGTAVTALAAGGTNDANAFTDDREKASYAVGMVFGSQIKNSHMDLDLDLVIKTMKATLAGTATRLNEQDAQRAIMTYAQQQVRALSEKNSKAGAAFLAEQRRKSGVQAQPVIMPDGTSTEFLDKDLTEGHGGVPTPSDTVKISYHGTFPDGKEITGPYGKADGVQLAITRVPLRGMA